MTPTQWFLGPAATFLTLALVLYWIFVIWKRKPVERPWYRIGGVVCLGLSLSMWLGLNDGGYATGGYGGTFGRKMAAGLQAADFDKFAFVALLLAVLGSLPLATDWLFIPLILRRQQAAADKARNLGRMQPAFVATGDTDAGPRLERSVETEYDGTAVDDEEEDTVDEYSVPARSAEIADAGIAADEAHSRSAADETADLDDPGAAAGDEADVPWYARRRAARERARREQQAREEAEAREETAPGADLRSRFSNDDFESLREALESAQVAEPVVLPESAPVEDARAEDEPEALLEPPFVAPDIEPPPATAPEETAPPVESAAAPAIAPEMEDERAPLAAEPSPPSQRELDFAESLLPNFLSEPEPAAVMEPPAAAASEPVAAQVATAESAEPIEAAAPALDPDTELFQKAGDLVVESQRASISFLQRSLSVNYFQAAKLLDRLEKEGVIGPYTGAVNREVRMDAGAWGRRKNG